MEGRGGRKDGRKELNIVIYRRKEEQGMEMLWKAGEGGEEGEIFTGINYNTYSPPPGTFFLSQYTTTTTTQIFHPCIIKK